MRYKCMRIYDILRDVWKYGVRMTGDAQYATHSTAAEANPCLLHACKSISPKMSAFASAPGIIKCDAMQLAAICMSREKAWGALSQRDVRNMRKLMV